MTARPLTAAMVITISFIAECGGELVRYAGGYWGKRGAPILGTGHPRDYVNASSVAALVKRGELRYSEWQKGRDKDFPIAVMMVPHLEVEIVSGKALDEFGQRVGMPRAPLEADVGYRERLKNAMANAR